MWRLAASWGPSISSRASSWFSTSSRKPSPTLSSSCLSRRRRPPSERRVNAGRVARAVRPVFFSGARVNTGQPAVVCARVGAWRTRHRTRAMSRLRGKPRAGCGAACVVVCVSCWGFFLSSWLLFSWNRHLCPVPSRDGGRGGMAELDRLGHGTVRNRRAVARLGSSALGTSENDDDRQTNGAALEGAARAG